MDLESKLSIFTMATTKVNIESDVEAPQEVSKVSFQRMSNYAADAMFERNHPFYKDWHDWNSICKIYHSDWVRKMSKWINKGNRSYNDSHILAYESWLVDEIYFKHNRFLDLARFPNTATNIKYDWHKGYKQEIKESTSFFFCECYNELNESCQFFDLHLRAYIIAFMWAYCFVNKPRRSYRKYYVRLERILLALPLDKLKLFDPKLVTEPRSIGSPRHLLRDLYNRGYFEPYSTRNFVEKIEWLKHFRVMPEQQGGKTKQCLRDTEFVQTLRLNVV